MNDSNQSPDLLKLMFAECAAEVLSISPRLELWSKAFASWLSSIQATRGPIHYNQAHQSWKLLLHFCRLPPWAIDRSILEDWLVHLAKTGLKPGTIRCYQGRISGFYRYCSKQPEIRSADPLLSSSSKFFNPLRGTVKPKQRNYQNAYILRSAEACALLRVIDRQSSLVGKRDYALFLTLLLTGLPESELRHLQWKHIRITPQGTHLFIEKSSMLKELPPAAWSAIIDYLESSGRFASIQPDDYIFCPLADPLLHPPSAKSEDWLASRPLSQEQILVWLKVYAAWAGLDSSKVTYACLRHTAAALQLENGAGAAGLQAFLGRIYLKETRRYISHLGSMLAKRRLASHRFVHRSLHDSRNRYCRKKPYGQIGNQNAFRHGFYSHRLLTIDLQDQHDALAATLDSEIIALRVLLRRALYFAGDFKSFSDALRMLDLSGRTATRIARLLRNKQKLEADKPDKAYEQELLERLMESSMEEQEG